MRNESLETPRHEPVGYRCPFCALLRGQYNERNQADDIVCADDLAFARISPKWWPGNPGAVLVIPNEHHENIYDLPASTGAAVWDLTRRVARAMRTAYGCEGTSLRQHNEPAGGQDVWHLHVHVFPRYAGDDLYLRHREARWASPEERKPFADKLRAALA